MIGDKIKNCRRNMGIAQGALADALMISSQAVSKWERGLAQPDISMLVPIADFFGVSTDYLLREDKDTPVSDQNFWETKLSKPTKNCVRASIKNLSPFFLDYLEYEIIIKDADGEMLDHRRGKEYDFPSGYTKSVMAFFPGINKQFKAELKIIGYRIGR